MYPLICVDCRWFIEDNASTKLHKCKASEKVDLVTGERTYQFCTVMRLYGGDCGLEGKLFSLNISDPEGEQHGE